MNEINRRRLLQLSALAGIGAAVSRPVEATAPALSKAFSGRIIGLGFGAKRSSMQAAQGSSIITEVDVTSGQQRSAVLPIAVAHTLVESFCGLDLCLPQDGARALWIDRELKIADALQAPVGFLFSGHGVVAKETGIAYLSLRRVEARTFADTGRIALVDLRRRRFVAMFDSGGVRPHDLALSGQTLLISHYGDLSYDRHGKTAGNQREPRLVSLDSKTGRILQSINTPADGSLTHFALGKNGSVCAVPLKYYGFDDEGRRAVEQALGGKDFEISVAEELEGRIAAPMPILMLDRQNGSFKVIRGELEKQRRAQSVAYHAGTDRFFISYSFSDMLACVDEVGVRYISGFELGLSYVRGVCSLGDSGLIAVSGEFRGLSLVDAKSLKVVRRLDVSWFDNAHLSYRMS